MGNSCPACFSRGDQSVHHSNEEEEDDDGTTSVKVLRTTDGELFHYPSPVYVKDLMFCFQGFVVLQNLKHPHQQLHPQTQLKLSHVYYLMPGRKQQPFPFAGESKGLINVDTKPVWKRQSIDDLEQISSSFTVASRACKQVDEFNPSASIELMGAASSILAFNGITCDFHRSASSASTNLVDVCCNIPEMDACSPAAPSKAIIIHSSKTRDAGMNQSMCLDVTNPISTCLHKSDYTSNPSTDSDVDLPNRSTPPNHYIMASNSASISPDQEIISNVIVELPSSHTGSNPAATNHLLMSNSVSENPSHDELNRFKSESNRFEFSNPHRSSCNDVTTNHGHELGSWKPPSNYNTGASENDLIKPKQVSVLRKRSSKVSNKSILGKGNVLKKVRFADEVVLISSANETTLSSIANNEEEIRRASSSSLAASGDQAAVVQLSSSTGITRLKVVISKKQLTELMSPKSATQQKQAMEKMILAPLLSPQPPESGTNHRVLSCPKLDRPVMPILGF